MMEIKEKGKEQGKKEDGERLSIVTTNEGKYKEYEREISKFTPVEMVDIDYPEIQTSRLEEVVEKALKELKDHAPLMVDDSGLFIEDLDGFPGVYSSYVHETLGCEGILSLMEGKEERKARFECVIGFYDEGVRLFKGISRGEITKEMRGSGGFGYDPIFRPEGWEKTFAEVDSERKNEVSHRGIAVKRFLRYLEKEQKSSER